MTALDQILAVLRLNLPEGVSEGDLDAFVTRHRPHLERIARSAFEAVGAGRSPSPTEHDRLLSGELGSLLREFERHEGEPYRREVEARRTAASLRFERVLGVEVMEAHRIAARRFVAELRRLLGEAPDLERLRPAIEYRLVALEEEIRAQRLEAVTHAGLLVRVFLGRLRSPGSVIPQRPPLPQEVGRGWIHRHDVVRLIAEVGLALDAWLDEEVPDAELLEAVKRVERVEHRLGRLFMAWEGAGVEADPGWWIEELPAVIEALPTLAEEAGAVAVHDRGEGAFLLDFPDFDATAVVEDGWLELDSRGLRRTLGEAPQVDVPLLHLLRMPRPRMERALLLSLRRWRRHAEALVDDRAGSAPSPEVMRVLDQWRHDGAGRAIAELGWHPVRPGLGLVFRLRWFDRHRDDVLEGVSRAMEELGWTAKRERAEGSGVGQVRFTKPKGDENG